MTLTHEGGDGLDGDNIDVTVNGEQAWDVDSSGNYSALWPDGEEITAGSSARVVVYDGSASDGDDYTHGGGHNELTEGDTVRVTWTAEDGDRSSTLLDRDVN